MILLHGTTWLDLLTSVNNVIHNSSQAMAWFLACGIVVYIIFARFLTSGIRDNV